MHWDRYVQVGEPKNQSNTSEVPPLFILPVWWQLCEKHMEKVTLLKTTFHYRVRIISGVSLPWIQLTRSLSSVLVDCLQSGCQTVEPDGGKNPSLFRAKQMISGHDKSVIKENPFIAWWMCMNYASNSHSILAHEKYKWNKKKFKSLAHLQQHLPEAVKGLCTHS